MQMKEMQMERSVHFLFLSASIRVHLRFQLFFFLPVFFVLP
jgi:hypothetical protein